MLRLCKYGRVPLRLMPLGGLITYGQGPSDGNGYRKILREMLNRDGYEIQMVGSRNTGTMENNDHEGWRGYRVEQITGKAQILVPKLRPNVVAVNAGSNDCLQWFEMGAFDQRITRLLDVVWEGSPHSTILLSTLLVMANEKAEMRLRFANDCIRNLAEKKRFEHKRILLVDMQDATGPQICDLSDDGVHPKNTGYEKMAKKWLDGVREASRNGFLELQRVGD